MKLQGNQRIDQMSAIIKDPRQRNLVVSAEDDILNHLNFLESVGAQRVMPQWLDLEDINSLRALAEAILI